MGIEWHRVIREVCHVSHIYIYLSVQNYIRPCTASFNTYISRQRLILILPSAKDVDEQLTSQCMQTGS